MEDPKYNASIKVGSKDSSYSFLAFPRGATGGLQASQSFILELTFTDEQTPGQPFDISGSTATLYCTGYNVQGFNVTMLGAGVLSDSGSGTTDRVTFTVTKDQIPDDLGNLPATKNGNSVFYCILEDADTKLQFYQTVNILDQDFQLTGENSVSENIILAGGNDLGTVINTQIATPPVGPSLGDSYIVATGGTGDWSGKDGQLAVFNGSDWIFRTPETGNFVYDSTADASYTYDSAAWNPFTPADGSITQAKLDAGFTLPDDNVTNTQLADMTQDTIKGRATSGTGDPEDLTSGQVRSILNIGNVDNTSDADKPVSTAQDLINQQKLGVTEQAADSAKFAGYTLDATNISNGRVIAMKSGLNEFEFVDQSGGGGSGGFDFPYLFSTDITATDPTSGGIKFNNATPASVTEIYISSTDNDGMLIDTLINSLGSGDQFVLKQSDTPGNRLRFNVTSVTDNTGWITVAGTVADSGPLPSNGSACGTGFEYVSGGGGSGVTSVNGQTGAVTTPTETDELNLSAGVTVAGSNATDAMNNLDANKMDTATYDAAGIAEQLVGLTATQSMTNKTVNGVNLNGSGSASLFLDQTGNYSLPPGAGGGESNTASNVGGATGEVFKQKSGVDLEFKTLVGGSAISLVNGTDTVTINGTGEANAGTNLGGGEGIYSSKSSTNLQFKSLVAGSGVALSSTSNEITITSTGGGGGFPTGNVSVTQSATPTIDWALGDTFELGVLTLTNTISFTNVSQGQTIAITFTIDAGASYTVNLPGTVTALEGGSVDTAASVYNTIYITAINGTIEQHGAFSTDTGGGGGGGATNWTFTSTSATAAAGEKHIISGASTVLTFPAAPADGTEIQCIRDDFTNVPAVARGGTDTINGVTTNMTLDIDQGRTLFVYDLTNTNWRAYNV